MREPFVTRLLVPLSVVTCITYAIAAVDTFRLIGEERRGDVPPRRKRRVARLALAGLVSIGLTGMFASGTFRYRTDQLKNLQRQKSSPDAIEAVRRRGRGEIFASGSALVAAGALAVASTWLRHDRDKRKAVAQRFTSRGIDPL